MSRRARALWVTLWALWGVYAVAMLATVPSVPFHPDESTHLFLSRDFDTLVWERDPAGVTWLAAGAPEAVRRYRLLDAPLSRYLVGLSRTLTGQHDVTLAADWNWAANWEANAAAGALPSAALLSAARLPAALATVFGALLVFAIGRRAGGLVAGVSAAALYAANGALWLHGRRGMSEGLTIFAILLTVWVGLRFGRRAVAAGAAVALAVAAKLSGLALLPAAGLAVWLGARSRGWRSTSIALALCSVSFIIASWVLSPALWAAPLGGLKAMQAARSELLREQTAALRAAGGPVMDGLAQQSVALVYHLFFAPLTFWELPNYALATAATEARYAALPWQTLFRAASPSANLPAGALLLALTVAGLLTNAMRWVRGALPPEEGRALALIAVATAGVAATTFAFSIAWQRYYLPLLPLVCVWGGLGLAALARPLAQRWSAERKGAG